MNPPGVYGFNYRFNNKNYATDVMADSPEEAVGKIRAMAAAILVGRFVKCPSSGEPSEPLQASEVLGA